MDRQGIEPTDTGTAVRSDAGTEVGAGVRNDRIRVLRSETWLVLGLSLGAAAVYAVVSITAKLTANRPLAEQTAVLNASRAPGRPWLDLTYQLLGIAFNLVPVLLAIHLLNRDPGNANRVLGFDKRRPWFDGGAGVALAAIIGLPGLGLYVAARAIGINAAVVPAALPKVWWGLPVLVLSAAQNGLLEEIVVVGYLLTRLRATGFPVARAVAASALLRGTYHLYQGFGAFVGNAVMGAIFGMFFVRTRRIWPLVIAHTILDIVSFVGYAVFREQLNGLLGLS